MPTTTVSTIGTTGRDYSTIQAWEDACPANLVTNDEIWKGECYNDSEFFLSGGGTILAVSGVTCDATRYLWITAASGQSFADHANKATNPLEYDQSKGVGLRITGNYMIMVSTTGGTVLRMDRLQFFYDSTYFSNYYPPVVLNSAARVSDCLIEARRQTNVIFGCIGAVPAEVINCLIIDRGSVGCAAFVDSTPAAVGVTFVNCTALRPTDLSTGGIAFYGSGSNNQTVLKSCAAVGAFTDCVASTFATGSCNNNATTVGTMPGSSGLSGLTASDLLEGVVTSNIDGRVKAGSDLIGAAAVHSGYTLDLDIIGRARSTSAPTIGAWEYIAPGPTLSAPGTQDVTSTSVRPKVTYDYP